MLTTRFCGDFASSELEPRGIFACRIITPPVVAEPSADALAVHEKTVEKLGASAKRVLRVKN